MIRKFEIINKEIGEKEEIILRFVKEDELDKVMEFQEKIVGWLPNKDLYAISTKEEFARYIEKQGRIIGGFTKENNIIAIGVYCLLGEDKENYGYDIGLKGEELLEVAQIESTLVHKDYRGNNLQDIICAIIEELAIENKIKILMATVSPENPYSLNTFIKNKFIVEKEKLKYGGLRRCILSKKI